jgi:protein O-mannosyl-transferase
MRFRLLIAAVTFIAFARLCACDFTWWDDGAIHQNPLMNPPTSATLRFYWTTAGPQAPLGLYIPITYTAWAGLAKIAVLGHADVNGISLNAKVFHTANVLLHVLAACIAFELFRRLLGRNWPALAGALVFALHPVQVESVGWISGTKDILCGLFSLAALWQYVLFAQKSARPRAHYICGLVFFALAMLSKPSGMMVPVMAIVIDRLLLRRSAREILRAIWPWLALMIPCIVCTHLSQQAPYSAPPAIWTRPLIAADAIAFYLRKIIWPIHLCVDYGRRPSAVLATGWVYVTWIIPVALAAIALLLRRRHPIILAAGLLLVTPLLPVLGFVPFMFQFISTTADHYLYLAMIGPALLAAWCVSQSSKWIWFCAVAILAALLARDILLEPTWQNTQTLFQHTLDLNPHSFIACDMLGFIHGQYARQDRSAGRIDAAQNQFAVSVDYYQKGLAIFPDYVPSLYNLALDDQQVNRPEDARLLLRHIVQLQPTLPKQLQTDPVDLARRLVFFGDPAAAVDWLDRVLRSDPTNSSARQLRAQLVKSDNSPPTSR